MTDPGERLPTPRERRVGFLLVGIGFVALGAGIVAATYCTSGPITCDPSTGTCGPSIVCTDAGYGWLLVSGALLSLAIGFILIIGRAAHGEVLHPEAPVTAPPARRSPREAEEEDSDRPRWKLK